MQMCSITFLRCTRKVVGTLDIIYKPIMCQLCYLSVRIDSQIAFTMPDLGYPPRMGNWVICYEERQPLLLKWSFHFLRCTRKRRGTSESIYKPLIVNTVSFLLWSTLKFHTIYQILGYHIITGDGMLCYMERHPLLLKCLITFIRYIRKVGQASDNIYKPLIVHIVLFSLRLTLNLHTNTIFWVAPLHKKWDNIL